MDPYQTLLTFIQSIKIDANLFWGINPYQSPIRYSSGSVTKLTCLNDTTSNHSLFIFVIYFVDVVKCSCSWFMLWGY